MHKVRYISNPAGAIDYFREGAESSQHQARWEGMLKATLGLPDALDFTAFEHVVNNRHPLTGEQLTPRNKANRRGGVEFLFTGPKSVSAVALLSPDEKIREGVQRAFYDSALETMQDMESEFAVRDQRGGRNTRRIVGNGLYAGFLHDRSRPVGGLADFNLHYHFVAANVAYDPERKRFMGLEVEHIRRKADRFEVDFHRRLMDRLHGMGFELRPEGKYFEIEGIPKSLIDGFSRRTAQVKERAKERGLTTGKECRNLAYATRDRKDAETPADMRAQWRARLTPSEKDALIRVSAFEVSRKPRPSVHQSMEWAVKRFYLSKARVKDKDIIDRAVIHGKGRFSRKMAEDHLRRMHIPTKRGWCQLEAFRQQVRRKAAAFMDSLRRSGYNHEVQRGHSQRLDGIGRQTR